MKGNYGDCYYFLECLVSAGHLDQNLATLNLLSLPFARQSPEVRAAVENDHPLCRISILEGGGTTN